MTAWKKKIITVGENGERVEIPLVYNAMTFLIYKNYTGRDMMSDIVKLGVNQNNINAVKLLDGKKCETVEDVQKLGLSEPELEQLFDSIINPVNIETYLNIAAALIASARPQDNLSFDKILCDIIPADFAYNPDFLEPLSDFLINSSVLETVKKKAGSAPAMRRISQIR